MIMSGWILPDYTEVKCKSFSGCKEHIEIVKKYLDCLKASEPRIYEEVMKISKFLKISEDALDDIAVYVLGWAKVIDTPHKTLCYLSGFLYENIIIRYINLGFSLIPIYFSAPIKLPNPSLYLQ